MGGLPCCLLSLPLSPSPSQRRLSHMPRPFSVACKSLADSGRGRGGSGKGGRVAAAAAARRQRRHHGGGVIPPFPAPAKLHAEALWCVACRSLDDSGRGRGGGGKGGRVVAAAAVRRQRQHQGNGVIPSFPAPAKSHA